ncbi:MAG TPA: winged helix-turn-helix domain-containing protein [Candidatus Acidoferrales bacterium]
MTSLMASLMTSVMVSLMTTMAIGWLSREEKLQFEQANGDYLIRPC